MTTQPEALRLADLLVGDAYWSPMLGEQTAAELRRLHAELERCKFVCAATVEAWREDSEDLRLHRDILLGALDVVLDDLMYKDHARVIDVARAAIATVEGEKT